MRRVCFQSGVKPGHLETYAGVCPEMLEAFRETAWRIHSIFVPSEGLVIGYFETDGLRADLDGMAAAPVNARWQAAMAEHFVDLDVDVPVDQAFLYLDEVFNLDDQLTSVNQNGIL